MDQIQRHRGCLLGLACGDAVGTTVEFRHRGSFPPVTDMTGGGPFRLPPGAWTDDTSMALCLATSLVQCNGFDAVDQMQRYCDWHWNGYLSSTGRCFDIGFTTREALANFKLDGNPFAGSTSPGAAGNGCIMRLAPVPMWFHHDAEAAMNWSGESSRTTHGAAECIEASKLFSAMLVEALHGGDKESILFRNDPKQFVTPNIRSIAAGGYRHKEMDDVFGSGYVVKCLEAAAWCFWKSTDFRDAVLMATNLGDDADTTAAVCGQLAGAFYGESGIPADWRAKLVMTTEIRDLADRLAERS